VLALLLAIIAIHAGRVLHDGVPSSLRAGVSSGVGTFSWILFLPFSLVFGWWAREHGVQDAAWFITAAALGVALLLAASGQRRRPAVAEDPHEFACQDLVELATDFMDGVLPADRHAELQEHLAGCDGCMTYVEQLGLTARALRDAGFELPMHTHVTPA
jgi:hypothetical protein